MKRVIRFFENLLFPPRCVSCGEYMQKDILDPCNESLCPSCRLKWEKEKGEPCPDCGAEAAVCRCVSSAAKKSGVSDNIKLVNYYADRKTVGRQSILYMKKHANAKAFTFFAHQLSYSVKNYMDEKGWRGEQVVFCSIPRGRKNARVYGFDQAEVLAKRLASFCGSDYCALLSRRRGKEVEQKKLSADGRKQNVKGKFLVNPRRVAALEDIRAVFLVDDVVTTGASICSAAEALRGADLHGDVVVVSLARTPMGRRKRPF